MKHIFTLIALVVLAFIFMTASIISADDSAYKWTGVYLGLQGGYSDGHTNWKYENGNRANHNIQGWMYGIFAGYNYQLPANLVVGIDADINKTKLKGHTACPNPSWTCSSEINWMGSVRTRVGYAIDRLLPYIGVGLIHGSADINTTDSTGKKYGTSKTFSGWTRSIGLEYAITNNITARVEYDGYHSHKHTATVDSDLNVTNRFHFQTTKLGFSYKF